MATTILHVDSSPLGEASASRRLTADIVAALVAAAPGARVLRRDLASAPLAHLSGATLQGWGAADLAALAPEARAEAELSEAVLAEFLAADTLVIGAPMYNFSVPSQLKAWIDRVVRAGRTFRYGDKGPVGLATGKRAIVASSRGGAYAGDAARAAFDHQEAYLRTVLGFVGIADVAVVRAEGLAMGEAARGAALAAAARDIAGLSVGAA
jgi:FMN-dependent NADH-azoreductase